MRRGAVSLPLAFPRALQPVLARALPLALPLALALTLAPALAATASPAAAQEEERSCRCVDRDGNVIENCTCMRSFRLDEMPNVQAFGTMMRRSLIGVEIDYDQGGEHDREGARITSVRDDGPAEAGGLQTGDIVVRVDGRSVFEPLENRAAERSIDVDRSVPVQRFVHLVGQLEPDEPAEFEVLREGRSRTVTVTPEAAAPFGGLRVYGPDGDRGPEMLRESLENFRERWNEVRPEVFHVDTVAVRGLRFFPDSARSFEVGRLDFHRDACMSLRSREGASVYLFNGGNCVEGVQFIELNPELGEYFGTDRGVLVSEVAEESPLGLRPGDVLLAIDGREVSSPDQVRRILRSYENDEEFRLRVMRRGSEMEVLGRGG
jgi:membrane-associated protease RseP (regulator of RpoE activity)